ncbi:hypothetical protein BK123_28830 [Paenibacillus lautus]|uniref:Uncharacterized protein n=1 Tax=Paenibacillus lautus TaxID=1401 RepID=A0A1R1ATR2_PAELA|nr:hypothetical protein BK123_28830 [Paenibacillus lautus]
MIILKALEISAKAGISFFSYGQHVRWCEWKGELPYLLGCYRKGEEQLELPYVALYDGGTDRSFA